MARANRQVEAVTRSTTSRNNSVPGTESLMMSMSSAPAVGSAYQILRGLLPRTTAIPVSVRIVKRAVDLLAGAIGLFVFALLLPFIALAIYLDSPGPLFYRQRRAAVLRGASDPARFACSEFDMLKFRTMHMNAEARTG